MVSTIEGLDGVTLDFPNLIKLTELPKNFSIQLEVYGLQTKREVFGHEAKYHIKKVTILILFPLPIPIVAKLLFIFKNLYFVNDEVRAGCKKIGHAALQFVNELLSRRSRCSA